MTAGPIFGIKVDRWCRIRSETSGDEMPFPLDNAGFLDLSALRAASADTLVPGALVPPYVAAEAGALVLLGEPGLGKTTVFERLAEGTAEGAADSPQPPRVWIDAADLTDAATFDELLGRHLRALPDKQSAAHTADTANTSGERTTQLKNATLTVVIDQIDESPMILQLASRLRTCLRDRDTSGLRLLLACRTADYPSNLTGVLTSACGECYLADLAPLTQEKAARLVSSADQVHGESLIAAAIEAGAGALASVPLTLELLVRTYRKTGSLDARPAELFARGVAQLAEEHDDERQVLNDETSLEQRLMIAGRIAARLLLTGRRTIWRGSVLKSGEQDLNADQLADGHERSTGGPFAVTKKMVLAVLGTGLFTGRGRNRLAFRHGSIAAYLTARYLIDRDVPRAQLEDLFLVAGGDKARSIPALLREAAAWLVTLKPTHAAWLAEADPESLVSHSPIVDSDEVRALIVDALLRRASEVELGDVPWARSPRRLQHPGMADQLLTVFKESGGREPEDWSSFARVRLAIRLAREARTPGLAPPLLDLAESDAWSAHIRQLAALTAFETNPESAIPRLTGLLERFTDVNYAADRDPDDELRGSLLTMLWPGHVSTEQVLHYLRRRRTRGLIGSYLFFRHAFLEQLPEEDIPLVLRWAKEQVEPGGARADSVASDNDPHTQGDLGLPNEDALGGLDKELIEGIVDRALAGPTALDHVDDVGALIRPRLESFDNPALPAPVDLDDEVGQEPPAARDLRRALTRSLVQLILKDGQFNRADAFQIIGGWGRRTGRRGESVVPEGLQRAGRTHLLTARDFPWVYEAAADAESDGSEALADALGQVAAMVFNPTDVKSVDLVYAHQEHPVWPHVSWWFQPVDLDSEQAKHLKEAHGHRHDAKEPWPEAELFVSDLNSRLRDAAEGNTDAFWQLVWGLQFDPATGHEHTRRDDDLLGFPGIVALDGDPGDALVNAATHFVASEHDHANEWLGTRRHDKRGWAGYLALAFLDRQGRLEDVPDRAWASWVGALVWFPATPVNAGDRDRKTTLLSFAAEHAPAQLAAATSTYLRGELAHGRLAPEVELIDPGWDHRLADTWTTLLGELAEAITRHPRQRAAADDATAKDSKLTKSNDDTDRSQAVPATIVLHPTDGAEEQALRLWETMLMALVGTDDERAAEIARRILQAGPEGRRERLLATRAARTLLRTGAQTHWPKILTLLEQDNELSRDVALACATGRDEAPIFVDLDEEQLAGVYRWLSALFPPEEDVRHEGFHFISAEEEAREWRDRILSQLSERGTEQSVLMLVKLGEEYPDRIVITSSLLRARTNVFASAWSPPSPEELAALFEDARRRLVRSEGELAGLLLEVFKAVERELPAHGELLWDRLPKRVLPKKSNLKEAWLPKPEAALSAYLALQLSIRLDRHGLAVNREVLVRPTNAYGAGDRTDILIEATMRDDPVHGPAPARFVVVVEVKGPWHEELMTAQREQLAKRYLPEAYTETGIYLVGWYPLDLWTDKDDPSRNRVRKKTRDELAADLEAQAKDIRADLAVRTTPFLLDIPRPASPTH